LIALSSAGPKFDLVRRACGQPFIDPAPALDIQIWVIEIEARRDGSNSGVVAVHRFTA